MQFSNDCALGTSWLGVIIEGRISNVGMAELNNIVLKLKGVGVVMVMVMVVVVCRSS
jgi:hypothetical protein